MGPPLRWPGSKWKSADYILSQCGYFNEWREPFAGSAGVFWRLPKWHFKRIWLNDINPDPINFFRAMKSDRDFIARAIHYATTYREAKEIRAIWPIMIERFVVYGDMAAYWFLNRYAVAGRVSRTRKTVASLPLDHKLDAYVSRYCPRRFTLDYWQHQRRRLQNVELTTLDYRELLAEPSPNNCACYMDVPYRIGTELYQHGFTDEQYHELRAAMLASPLTVKALTTGNDVLSDLLFRCSPFELFENHYTRSCHGTVHDPSHTRRRTQFLIVLNGNK